MKVGARCKQYQCAIVYCQYFLYTKREENNLLVVISVRALNREADVKIDLNSEPVVYCEFQINIRMYSAALAFFFRIEFITITISSTCYITIWACYSNFELYVAVLVLYLLYYYLF